MLWIFFTVPTFCDYLCQEFLIQKQNLFQINYLNRHNEGQYSIYQSQDYYAPSETYKIRLRYLTMSVFMFAPCINSIKDTFIVPTDAHCYKIIEILKQF
jgi:hypothetical protein